MIYAVANPVRGLLDRKRSKQKQNQKQKRQKKRNNSTKHMSEKIGEGHSLERVWCREPTDTSPGYLTFAPEDIASTTMYSQGFGLLYRYSRRRLGSPWVGPINAALKRLKLATATQGATSTLSACSVSLFLCWCLEAFSSSFTHAAINLQPLHVLCCTRPRVMFGGAPVPRCAK